MSAESQPLLMQDEDYEKNLSVTQQTDRLRKYSRSMWTWVIGNYVITTLCFVAAVFGIAGFVMAWGQQTTSAQLETGLLQWQMGFQPYALQPTPYSIEQVNPPIGASFYRLHLSPPETFMFNSTNGVGYVYIQYSSVVKTGGVAGPSLFDSIISEMSERLPMPFEQLNQMINAVQPVDTNVALQNGLVRFQFQDGIYIAYMFSNAPVEYLYDLTTEVVINFI